jgi:hypothetical protein
MKWKFNWPKREDRFLITMTNKEWEAFEALAKAHDLSHGALALQAISFYQGIDARLAAGETCTWSGDANRAREFAGLPLLPPGVQPQDLALEQACDALKAVRDKFKKVPGIQGREYVDLGIQVNNAIAEAQKHIKLRAK